MHGRMVNAYGEKYLNVLYAMTKNMGWVDTPAAEEHIWGGSSSSRGPQPEPMAQPAAADSAGAAAASAPTTTSPWA